MSPADTTAQAAATVEPLTITKELLRDWQACADGVRWFLGKFPQGASYGDVQSALRADKRTDDSRWLTERVFESLLKTPSATTKVVAEFKTELDLLIAEAPKSDVAASEVTNDSGDYAQIGSSGDSAQIGSSGDYARIGSSGDYAQIGSSGDSAQIGSSGDYARIGSSGDYARINAEGSRPTVAVAGLDSRVRVGDEGAVSVAYSDGKRIRFAVGYVGENIKANTWYQVSDKGEFVECAA